MMEITNIDTPRALMEFRLWVSCWVDIGWLLHELITREQNRRFVLFQTRSVDGSVDEVLIRKKSVKEHLSER